MTQKAVAPAARVALDSALGGARLTPMPFPHVAVQEIFDQRTADALLGWMEQDAPWAFRDHRWYLQDGCKGVADQLRATPAAAAGAPETFQTIRGHLERLFRRKLSDSRFELNASRMLPGHRIDPHNDRPHDDTETHRLIVNLNRGFDDDHGGHLILFAPENPADTAVVLRPLHNSASAIEFSARSWHCVDEIRGGARYALLYSFWADD